MATLCQVKRGMSGNGKIKKEEKVILLVQANNSKVNSPLVECLQHDAEMFLEVSIRHHENIVAFPCWNLEN